MKYRYVVIWSLSRVLKASRGRNIGISITAMRMKFGVSPNTVVFFLFIDCVRRMSC